MIQASLIATIACLLGQTDPGTVVVVDGGLKTVAFSLPAGTPYQLEYPTQRISVWFDAEATVPAAPFTTYYAESKGDVNGDGEVNGADIECFSDVLTPPFSVTMPCHEEAADFDDSGTLDTADIEPFVEAVLAGFPPEAAVLHIVGESPSVTLGDVELRVLSDPENDGTFVLQELRAITVVQFVMQMSGELGVPSEVYMTPAIAPLAFSSLTTGTWTGSMNVSSGPAEQFSFIFSAAELYDRSPDHVTLFTGEGTRVGTISGGAILACDGSATGALTFDFNGFAVSTPPFTVVRSAPQFRFRTLVFDLHDPGGVLPTYGAITQIPPLLHTASLDASELTTYWGYQVALEVLVASNVDSDELAPSSLAVVLISLSPLGQIEDALVGLSLQRIDAGDDPDYIEYRTATTLPLLFADSEVSGSIPSGLRVLRVAPGGHIVVVPD